MEFEEVVALTEVVMQWWLLLAQGDGLNIPIPSPTELAKGISDRGLAYICSLLVIAIIVILIAAAKLFKMQQNDFKEKEKFYEAKLQKQESDFDIERGRMITMIDTLQSKALETERAYRLDTQKMERAKGAAVQELLERTIESSNNHLIAQVNMGNGLKDAVINLAVEVRSAMKMQGVVQTQAQVLSTQIKELQP